MVPSAAMAKSFTNSIRSSSTLSANTESLPPGEMETTAAWFSGWFNQKLNDTSIDFEAFRKNTRNVAAFCKNHPNDQLFGVLQLAVNQAMKKH